MVQLAVPRELTVGALLLRAAAGKVGECDALIGKLALLNEIGVRSVRQADGEVIARALVGTGIRFALPDGYVAFVVPRSGLAVKHGITVLNSPGTIDAGYRGEIKVPLLNTDPHAPAPFRAVGAPSNLDSFARAFGCKAGDAMVRPEDVKVVLW